MEKATFDKYLKTLESAGIKDYLIRFEGGNRTIHNLTDSSILIETNDGVLSLQTEDNYASKYPFKAQLIPYEDINDISSNDLSVKDIINLIQASGGELTDEIKEFLAKRGNKVSIDNPANRANYGETLKKDDKGNENPELNYNIPARKTY